MKKGLRDRGTKGPRVVGTWGRGNVGTGARGGVCVTHDHVLTFPRSHVHTLRRSLTLVELMVVIVILGILATTVTVSVRDYLITGKQSAAKQEIAQITTGLELFYVENDRYPHQRRGPGRAAGADRAAPRRAAARR